MNKSMLLLGASALALSTAAHADLFKVAVNGGYTTVTMADYNAKIATKKKDLENTPGAVNVKTTPYSGGFFVAAEAGLALMPFIELGPRVEYVQVSQVSISYDDATGNVKATGDDTLTSFMLGLNTGLDLPLTGLGFNAGIYAGYGYAVDKGNTKDHGVTSTSLSAGGAFVGEVQAKLKYSIFPLISLDLLGGIRLANMGKLKDGATEDTAISDYSGFNAGAGLTVGF